MKSMNSLLDKVIGLWAVISFLCCLIFAETTDLLIVSMISFAASTMLLSKRHQPEDTEEDYFV